VNDSVESLALRGVEDRRVLGRKVDVDVVLAVLLDLSSDLLNCGCFQRKLSPLFLGLHNVSDQVFRVFSNELSLFISRRASLLNARVRGAYEALQGLLQVRS
jgi:hypothetical protein